MEADLPMTNKPIHYDGSIQNNETSTATSNVNEPFTLTDEMRVSISGNPYFSENNN
jgi:hypothetical protein